MLDPTDIAGVEAAAENRRAEQKLESERDMADLEAVLDTEAGRRYLWRIISTTGVYRSSFTGDNTTYFREGQRNVGLIIVGEIMQNFPKMYSKMMEEANGRRH